MFKIILISFLFIFICTNTYSQNKSIQYFKNLGKYNTFNINSIKFYLKAKYYYNRKHYSKAIKYFKYFFKKKSLIKDYGLFFCGKSYFKIKNYNKAIFLFKIIRLKHKKSRFYENSIELEAESYTKLKKWNSLKDYIKNFKTEKKEELYIKSYYEGKYFEQTKKYLIALKKYQFALDTKNIERKKKIINQIEYLLKIYNVINNNKINLIPLGIAYYDNKNYNKSIKILSQKKLNLTNDFKFYQLYYISLSYLKLNKKNKARKLLKKITRTSIKLKYKIHAAYYYYKSLENINPQITIKGYKILAKYNNDFSIKINEYLIKYYKNNQFEKSKYLKYLSELNAVDIIWKSFFYDLNKNRLNYLITIYPSIINNLKNKEKNKSKYNYWLAIAAMKLKKYLLAQKFFIKSYLGYKQYYYSYKSFLYLNYYKKLKIFKINLNILKNKNYELKKIRIKKNKFKNKLQNSFVPLLDKKNKEILNKALYFYKANINKVAKIEMERFLNEKPYNMNYLRAISEYFNNQKKYKLSIYYANRLIFYLNKNKNYNYISKDLINLSYPKHYKSIVEKYSKLYKVNSNLIFAIIRTESRFEYKARSYAGARGIMQIMPKTAKYLSKKIKQYRYNIYNVNSNIKMGTYYISKLINQFNSYSYALASYNRGPTRTRKYLKKIKKNKYVLNGEHIIELINNNENRNYVKKVFSNFYSYIKLYEKLKLS